ncbi:hypothetical protein ACNOIU_07140 [Exiguobacterium mexicanum]|uniref:Lipoprotein n=2 Tax=Bacillales Family XII. Incertae Sedis TaxID=539742 RepID=A0ABT7MSZ0_9BACL|nr:hypothetical protein [Exiguobacterium mexicanum]MDL5378313.1 hypothetical protein [Exiguobacterium mexicanum]
MNKVKMSIFIFLLMLGVLGVVLAGCSSGNNAVDEGPNKKELVAAVGENEKQEGENTEEMAGNTAAQYYYTANEGGSISKIDAATNTIINTIELEGSVHNV